MVFSTVLSEDSVEWFRELISETEEMDEEFEALPLDADEAVIDGLAERMLPVVLRVREVDPWSRAPAANAPGGERNAKQTIAEAVAQLYNPAQLRVLKRVNELLAEAAANDGAPG